MRGVWHTKWVICYKKKKHFADKLKSCVLRTLKGRSCRHLLRTEYIALWSVVDIESDSMRWQHTHTHTRVSISKMDSCFCPYFHIRHFIVQTMPHYAIINFGFSVPAAIGIGLCEIENMWCDDDDAANNRPWNVTHIFSMWPNFWHKHKGSFGHWRTQNSLNIIDFPLSISPSPLLCFCWSTNFRNGEQQCSNERNWAITKVARKHKRMFSIWFRIFRPFFYSFGIISWYESRNRCSHILNCCQRRQRRCCHCVPFNYK